MTMKSTSVGLACVCHSAGYTYVLQLAGILLGYMEITAKLSLRRNSQRMTPVLSRPAGVSLTEERRAQGSYLSTS